MYFQTSSLYIQQGLVLIDNHFFYDSAKRIIKAQHVNTGGKTIHIYGNGLSFSKVLYAALPNQAAVCAEQLKL